MLGNIVERPSQASQPPTAPRAPTTSTSGFPTILHRSQKPKRPSAFAAASARSAKNTFVGKAVEAEDIPKLAPSSPKDTSSIEAGPSKPRIPANGGENEFARVKREIGDENSRRVAQMTDEERREEVAELQERFGAGVLDALRKRAEKRAAGGVGGRALEKSDNQSATSNFLATDKSDSQVGEAGPSRKAVRFNAGSSDKEPDLKSTYFPSTPAEPDKLAWMSPPSTSSSSTDNIRFDLSGQILSASQQSDLPAHLGLHHHGDQPDLAGYTIGEILHLCRSTVPAQRVGMLGLLTKIIALHVLTNEREGEEVRRICEREKVCERAVSLSVELLHSTRNVTLLQIAIQLLYTALGGPMWSSLFNEISPFQPLADADGRAAPISSVPFEDLLHRFSELLNTPDYLPSISIHHLTLMLRRATTSDRETAETILPLLPSIIQSHVTGRSWPVVFSKSPSVEPLRLMRDLIASSRLCATEIVEADLIGSLLRFCVISTWSGENTLGIELCTEVLKILGSLSRYGLSAGIARTAHDIWFPLGEYAIIHIEEPEMCYLELAESYLYLLEGWITCAIDPHRTTPEHDLTWTQMAGLGWADQALKAVEKLSQSGEMGEAKACVMAAAMRVLVAWATGLGINEVGGGMEQKNELRGRIGETGMGEVVKQAVKDAEESSLGDHTGDLILAALRLQAAFQSPPPNGNSTSPSTEHDWAIIDFTTLKFVSGSKPNPVNRYIQYELHRIGMATPSEITSESLQNAFEVLSLFMPGEEALALDLLDDLLKCDWTSLIPSLTSVVKGIDHPDSVTLLRPLLQYAILPLVTDITAPTQIHHLYLKATGSLRSPSPREPDETGRTPPGLPLRSDWLFNPIGELLHSADSAALQQAPADWNPTELQIVRSTLVLVRLALACGCEMGRSELMFGLMKIFMLEHQTTGMVDTGESEVYRDEVIKECLESLLDGLSVAAEGMSARSEQETATISASVVQVTPSLIPPSACTLSKGGIEIAATPYLGHEPFYQFFTDLVSLFENTSFGDQTFARILLPPLSMAYPADYRKCIWSNQNVVRLIRTQIEDVPLEQGIREFFEPVESDPEVLSAYGQALVRGWVKPTHGFLWSVAIHHLRAFFGQGDGIAEGIQETAGEKEKRIALARLRKGLRDAVMGSGNQLVVVALTEKDVSQPWAIQ